MNVPMTKESFCNEIVSDQMIALITPYVRSSQINCFGEVGLELTGLQIENASGEMITTPTDEHLKAIDMWSNRFPTNCLVKDLQCLLTSFCDTGVISTDILKVLDKHDPDTELKARQKFEIAKTFNPALWDSFASGYLKVNMIEVANRMPVSYARSLTRIVTGMLKCWKNINAPEKKSTFSNLKKILEEMVTMNQLDKAVLIVYDNVIDELYKQHCEKVLTKGGAVASRHIAALPPTSPATTICNLQKHYGTICDSMEYSCIDHLVAEGVLSDVQYEHSSELNHRYDIAKYVLNIIIARNQENDIVILKRALNSVKQAFLADLL